MKTYTVEQFKTYLENIESLGTNVILLDAVYYVSQIDTVLERVEEKRLAEEAEKNKSTFDNLNE